MCERNTKTWVASAQSLIKNLKLTVQQAVDAVAVLKEYRAKALEQLV